jgi:threonine dehydrogenase-like Zn-dependent dehydrogenase
VVINPNLGCGNCRFCNRGKPNLCDNLKTRNIKSNGGLSEYTAVDYRMAYRLPSSIPDEKAIFIEPLSCAVHIVQRAQIQPSETVAVFGAGVMGVLTGILLTRKGNKVYFVEKDESRRMQFSNILDYPVFLPGEIFRPDTIESVQVAIDCTGNAHAVCDALKLLQKDGRLVLSGLVREADSIHIPLIDITCKELNVQGVWLNPGTFEKAMDFVNNNPEVFNNFNTIEVKLSNIEKAFDLAQSTEYHKVIVHCTE